MHLGTTVQPSLEPPHTSLVNVILLLLPYLNIQRMQDPAQEHTAKCWQGTLHLTPHCPQTPQARAQVAARQQLFSSTAPTPHPLTLLLLFPVMTFLHGHWGPFLILLGSLCVLSYTATSSECQPARWPKSPPGAAPCWLCLLRPVSKPLWATILFMSTWLHLVLPGVGGGKQVIEDESKS